VVLRQCTNENNAATASAPLLEVLLHAALHAPNLTGMTAMARRTTPPQTVRLICAPGADGIGVFAIRAGTQSTMYTFREIPCFIGGRGFAVHRLGLGELYHVRVGDPSNCSCECLGFLAHGRCRHVLGLSALIQHGKL